MTKMSIIAAAALCLPILQPTHADESSMNAILNQWHQQITEYEAALSLATSDARRELITPPSADDIAPALWKAVRASTGTRLVQLPPEPPVLVRDKATGKLVPKKSNNAPRSKKVKTYEFEQPWAAPAVAWLLSHPEAFAKVFGQDSNAMSAYTQALLNSILRVHYAHPCMSEICPALAGSTSPEALKIAEKIYEQNPDPTAKACAAVTLSILMANPALSAGEGGQAQSSAKRLYYIKQALHLAPENAKYGSLPLDSVMQEQLYHLRRLVVGMAPPRFAATGLDGRSLQFPVKGKCNLIFFWSPDEELGLSIMRRQMDLLKRYPDLVLCPLVPHGDADEWKELMQAHNIGICYMDDAQGSAGTDYRVAQLPLAVLTDSHSAIRYIGYPDMKLQAALDDCFAKKPALSRPAEQPTSPTSERKSPPVRDNAPPSLRPMPDFTHP